METVTLQFGVLPGNVFIFRGALQSFGEKIKIARVSYLHARKAIVRIIISPAVEQGSMV